MRKSRIGAILCVSMLVMTAMLGNGCARKDSTPLRPGMAEHDILTLDPVPEDKLLITIRGEDNVNGQLIKDAIEAKFPEVEIVVSENTNFLDLKEKNFEDIFLTSDVKFLTVWNPAERFVDLSDEKFVNNYYLSSLNNCKYEGSLYYLPGPSTIMGIVYDKELFAENGWEVPHSLTEFETLCQTINATGIRAFQPSLYYNSSVKTFFQEFNYSTVYAGTDNIKWLEDYQKGKESMTGHLEPAFERMEQFLEMGIYQPGDFDVQPIERSQLLYRDHACAMIQEGLAAVGYAKDIGGEEAHEIGIMPWWSGDGPDDDYVFTETNYFMAVNKKLEESPNKEKLEKVLEILEYLSTPEGQNAVMLEEAPMIGSIKNGRMPEGEFAKEILETLEKGNQVPYPSYGKALVEKTDIAFTKAFREFSEGTKTAKEVMAICDSVQKEAVNADVEEGLYSIGTAKEDFTVLETAEYIADMFRRKADADIGLCRANTRASGCNAELYEGEILNYEEGAQGGLSICYTLDRGFGFATNLDENGACLIKMTMTGADIEAALNEVYNAIAGYPADYIVSSGLKIEFAPWAGDGNRVVSVTLADGSKLEPEKEYTVAAWNGTVDPKRVTRVESTYKETFIELFAEALKEDSPIAPFKDDRFVLNWNMMEDK